MLYKTVISDNRSKNVTHTDFDEIINSRLKEGWLLYGETRHVPETSSKYAQMSQVMIKLENNEKLQDMITFPNRLATVE